jgi:hypothetical protein
MRRLILLCALAAALAGRVYGGVDEPPAQPAAISLSDAEKERFLLEGSIVRTKSAPGGITASLRASLRRNGFDHDAHIQTINEEKPYANLAGGVEMDFRDSYKNNVAAYRLDRLLGLGMIPVTVVRDYDMKKAAFTWWVDDVMLTEKERLAKKVHCPDVHRWNDQMWVVRVFDQLIYNVDRNLGNLLVDREWRIWMIDHTRGFKIFKELKTPKDLGDHCERSLLASLKRLDAPVLKASMKDLLNEAQITALLGRRDVIVKYYESRIGSAGEDAVLYDLASRSTSPPN